MASRTESNRKRKQTAEKLEAVVSSSDDDQNKRKDGRVSTNASAAPATSLHVDTPVTTEKANTTNTASAITARHEEWIQSIGKLIQDLFHSDNAKVNAALDALDLDFIKDKKNCESLVTAGGCFVLTHLMKNCLDKAIGEIPACDQVTKLTEFIELTTIHKTLNVITSLTFWHAESKIGIAAIGGVEAVVKVMKTFPKCQILQKRACDALCYLTWCSIVKTKAIESCGLEALLAAIDNHLDSAYICKTACWALFNIVIGCKETIELLISLGGVATVLKVRTKWPDIDEVHKEVKRSLVMGHRHRVDIAVTIKVWVTTGDCWRARCLV